LRSKPAIGCCRNLHKHSIALVLSAFVLLAPPPFGLEACADSQDTSWSPVPGAADRQITPPEQPPTLAGRFVTTRAYVPWGRLRDAGNWLVVLFGMLLWLACLISLFHLGMRLILGRRDRRVKQKRPGKGKLRA